MKRLSVIAAVMITLFAASAALAQSGNSNGFNGSNSSNGSSSSSGGSAGSNASSSSQSSNAQMDGDTNTEIRQESHASSGNASAGSQIKGIDGTSHTGSTGGSSTGGGATEGSDTYSGDGSFDNSQTNSVDVEVANTAEEIAARTASAEGSYLANADIWTALMGLVMLLGFGFLYRKLGAKKPADSV